MGSEIAVLGAGNLGTANAIDLARKNPQASILIYDRNPDITEYIDETRQHPRYFPGVMLPDNVYATPRLEDLASADIFFIDINSAGIRNTFTILAKYLKDGIIIVNDAKGLEPETHYLPLHTVQEELARYGKTAVLVARSGWMKAENLLSGEKSFVDIASEDYPAREMVRVVISGENLEVRLTDDLNGVQANGVMKNVYALCAGFFDGMAEIDPRNKGLWMFCKKLYMAAATLEARQIGAMLGGKTETVGWNTYSWGRDFSNSCRKETANRLLGIKVGEGLSPAEAYEDVQEVKGRRPEGYNSTKGLYRAIEGRSPSIPTILRGTYSVLFQGADVERALWDGATELWYNRMLRRIEPADIGKAARRMQTIRARGTLNRGQ